MLAAHLHDGDKSSSHSSMKCSGSACCAAAAPFWRWTVPAPVLPSLSAAVVYSDFLPAVDLAHPERPPQGRYA
jgi:hypothetical protein